MNHRIYSVARLILTCSFIFFICSFANAQGTATSLNDGSAREALTLGQAIILGVVEGLTEFLPISSTGHLLLAEQILGIGDAPSGLAEEEERTKEATDAYTICIQAGAIIAVLGLYFRRVKQMLCGLIGRDIEGRKLLINIGAGFLPAAVLGLFCNKIIKSHLFGVWPVILAWFFGGAMILAVNWWHQKNERSNNAGQSIVELSWRMALIIGFAQCIAMWPGVSRSLVTIVGGVLVGLSLPAAVEFSFLLGLVTLTAATGYDALNHGQAMLQTFNLNTLVVGLVFAFIFAVLSMKWMVDYLTRYGLAIFGYYRILLALATGTFLLGGML